MYEKSTLFARKITLWILNKNRLVSGNFGVAAVLAHCLWIHPDTKFVYTDFITSYNLMIAINPDEEVTIADLYRVKGRGHLI